MSRLSVRRRYVTNVRIDSLTLTVVVVASRACLCVRRNYRVNVRVNWRPQYNMYAAVSHA